MSKISDGQYREQCEKYHLHPGFIYVSGKPTIITTVLGSCISLCLHDRRLKIGGMNHYIFPRVTGSDDHTARYGTAALPALLKTFKEFGSRREDLVAHIIGGAWLEVSDGSRQIANENCKLAIDFCSRNGIRVLSENTGGTMGRKVIYFTELHEVLVTMVEKIRESDYYDITSRFEEATQNFKEGT
jgi:chemotaxis protein CheD